jgi:glucose-1-phosphate cytidylyltransferase
MKVVLFCGGMGTRVRDFAQHLPKPLVPIGSRPILWHLMKYYAHFGHNDFILCLGYGSGAIKDYFLKYDECVSNDFVLGDGGRHLQLLHRDIENWRITFVDTGLHSNVGQRLARVMPLLEGEDMFLANYADGLTDMDLHDYVERFRRRDKVACFMSVPIPHSFHVVGTDDDDHVTAIEPAAESPIRINSGFFVLRREIFEYLGPGEELVVEPFRRLMAKRQLLAVPYDGFWRSMDTFKDKMHFDELMERESVPWQVWRQG